jgi:uncharacterized protein YbjT (DUF2867 family)
MIVVTGATGNVGRPLVSMLESAGAEVRPVTRQPLTLEGASALFVMLPSAPADPAPVLEAAARAGVQKLVLLSSQGVRTRPGGLAHAGLAAYEAAVRDSSLEWTVLRPGGFASNAFAWASSVRAERLVEAPFGDVGLPVVDPADIAAVAAAALLDEGHAKQTYELTGPRLVTPRQQAEIIGTALGATVRFAELSRTQALQRMSAFMPQPIVDGTLEILGTPTAEEQRISPDVTRVLGRPAAGFADWATRLVGAFRPA